MLPNNFGAEPAAIFRSAVGAGEDGKAAERI